MKKLETVTLLGVDCVDIDRLILAADISMEHIEFADVKLLTSLSAPRAKHIVTIQHIGSTEEYSRFVIEKLDEYVDTPHVLIIQYDGFVLNPGAWEDDFLKYDYTGAPWFVRQSSVTRFGFPVETRGTWVVGNGGFSLRSKRLLKSCTELAKHQAFAEYHPEDTQICVHHRTQF
jgi:hypothetical protein